MSKRPAASQCGLLRTLPGWPQLLVCRAFLRLPSLPSLVTRPAHRLCCWEERSSNWVGSHSTEAETSSKQDFTLKHDTPFMRIPVQVDLAERLSWFKVQIQEG